ncbi:hypothetical protein Taro_045369 [Colocasia esculenta]|uniref:F-box domain-containing protein n=1 Tax=Colocasia esculenta TaxID=4460 RepID=A0A843X6G4_COLES|nr:hypothetical protein [Colocasia esculenta]
MELLIPGLPDEIARECLVRVPYHCWGAVRSVCKLWRDEVESPDFHGLRRASGLACPVVALSQSEPVPVSGGPASKYAFTPSYRVALFEPDPGAWRTLPPVPGLPHGLPLFCQLAGAGRELVVVGGWNPETWVASDEVHVYDFIAGAWRRGARMPGPRRSFFACASDGRRTVFVAGGHDEDKNAMRSAMAYDVARDEWTLLPDMARDRDECKGMFRRGAFHVVGGYSTEMQGRFGKSSEAFDLAAWRWGPVEEDILEAGACPRTCVACTDGRVYRCRVGSVVVMEGKGWQPVAELPKDARVTPHMVAWRGKVLAMGSASHGVPHAAYILEEAAEGKGHRWERAVVPKEYSGQVQAGCSLEI